MTEDSHLSIGHPVEFFNAEPGDIRFLMADGSEHLRLAGDGRAYVRGEYIETNRELYDAFCEWMFKVRRSI